MQYKSITYQRVIIPKSYESKRLEMTVELDEGDDPLVIAKLLQEQVESLLGEGDVNDGFIMGNSKELKKAATLKSALKQNLDDINF